MCLYPQLIKNKKYVANKKNKGIVPIATDNRLLYVPKKCGKCIECKKQIANAYRMRLLEDIRHNKNAHMITLTFSNESIIELTRGADMQRLTGYELDNEIAIRATRKFNERWRKKTGKALRHWLITELGHNGTENIHMHGLIWTDKPEMIQDVWKYGYTHKGQYVNESTVSYITKYVTKMDFDHKEYSPRVLTSPGIGKDYTKRLAAKLNKYKGTETDEAYTTRTGYKVGLPVYLRNKIYTEEEREKLWLQKLDEQKRFVLGKEIDISKGEEQYYKALYAAREKNARLGYGNDEINWERKQYENDRRNMNYKIRKGIK